MSRTELPNDHLESGSTRFGGTRGARRTGTATVQHKCKHRPTVLNSMREDRPRAARLTRLSIRRMLIGGQNAGLIKWRDREGPDLTSRKGTESNPCNVLSQCGGLVDEEKRRHTTPECVQKGQCYGIVLGKLQRSYKVDAVFRMRLSAFRSCLLFCASYLLHVFPALFRFPQQAILSQPNCVVVVLERIWCPSLFCHAVRLGSIAFQRWTYIQRGQGNGILTCS